MKQLNKQAIKQLKGESIDMLINQSSDQVNNCMYNLSKDYSTFIQSINRLEEYDEMEESDIQVMQEMIKTCGLLGETINFLSDFLNKIYIENCLND